MWVSNLTTTGEWPVTIVNQILMQMPGLAKPQAKFIEVLIGTILALRGRVNYRNLSRYCFYSERTLARQFQRQFNWSMFNHLTMKSALKPSSTLIAAQDATFIPKSGKKTYGLDHFFNGCLGRAERGLEVSTLAVVDVTRNCAYTLAATQTPPQQELAKADKELSRVDFYLAQLREHRPMLPTAVKYLAADGFYAKQKYVDGVRACDLHLITKLRVDANLRYLYAGPRLKRRGRPKLYDGKVNFQDLRRFEMLGRVEEAEHLHLYTAVLYHLRLKRRLRVLVVLSYQDPSKPRYVVLASTDTELDGRKLYDLYRARFQIEFIFRDAKQFTGLSDCQSRNKQALEFHFNASLTTLNLARVEAVTAHQSAGRQVFSMASRKQQAFNERFIKVISEQLALDLTAILNHEAYDNLKSYGAIAA
jgi:DDE superfamily endonuclease